jgi:hypothetical protein
LEVSEGGRARGFCGSAIELFKQNMFENEKSPSIDQYSSNIEMNYISGEYKSVGVINMGC